MELARAPIHFHSSDVRFCGTKRQGRRFTLSAHEVTCPVCRAKDAAQMVKAALPAVYEQQVYTNA